MRGWECLVDGVADIDVSMTGERLFSVVVRQSSGQRTEKTFSLPVMLYRGVFRAGETYHPVWSPETAIPNRNPGVPCDLDRLFITTS